MKRIYYLWLVMLVSACHGSKERSEVQSLLLRGDSVIINDRDIYLPRIKIDTVKLQSYEAAINSSGIVRAISNNYAEIASPFAGRITRSYVRLGQRVKVDDPIFEISSPSYFEAGKTYFHTKQEMQLAEKNLRRQKDLFANGVGIEKEVEEADAVYDLASRDFENSVASLKVFRVKPEELVLGQPLIVRSPIDGEIVRNNIVLGQYLREDAEPVVIVAELSKVWVVGQIKEKDIKSIKGSDEVEIRLTGIPEIPIRGSIYYISELLDEETRSVQVFIECDNENRLMKPGMYVSAEFSTHNNLAVIIPTSAVYQAEGNGFVFVQVAPAVFVRRPIEYSESREGTVLVHSGLNPGDRIVTDGGILLLEAR
jgi:membrane fusion protein, heavy metal efflux system